MSGKIVNNYASLPVVFVKGKGATLIDTDGREYIDFVAGIGVNCLGHNHPALVQAIQSQAEKEIHISNYYNSDIGLAYADKLLAASNMEGVYYGNSGAEANEAAIKLARKYGWLKNGKKAGKHIIVTLRKSFHGRTLATLRATGQEKFHAECFAPFPEGFRHIQAHDDIALESVFDDDVCALLIECVQGEGGVNLIDAQWAQTAAAAARKVGALVMVDEVQTGMGRTGDLFACQSLGIQPDVITLAKGIAGGIPMGACLFRGPAANVFAAGDHQSTFAGNPLACAAAQAVLTELLSPGFLQHVREAGEYIRNTIKSWALDNILDVRGKGLMIGVDTKRRASDIQLQCLKNGLCISTAGENTLRFLPPLIISDMEITQGLAILKKILEEN